MKCPSCGAGLEGGATVCPYCGTPTAEAQREKQERESREHEDESKRTDRARESLKRTATHSLIWSIVGLVICCFPLSIVSLVLALRSRKMSKKYGLVLPMTATLGLAISGVGILLFGVLTIVFAMDQMALSARKDELAAQVAQTEREDPLTHQTACAMTELRILRDGYAGTSGISIDDFECIGKVKQEGDKAELDEITFGTTGSNRSIVRACFKKGEKWTIKNIHDMDAGTCANPPPPPPDKKKKRKRKKNRRGDEERQEAVDQRQEAR